MGIRTNLSIIRMSLIGAIYIFGLIVYFLTADLTQMLWFYPVGICWSAIYWPRRAKYRQFVERLEAP